MICVAHVLNLVSKLLQYDLWSPHFCARFSSLGESRGMATRLFIDDETDVLNVSAGGSICGLLCESVGASGSSPWPSSSEPNRLGATGLCQQ